MNLYGYADGDPINFSDPFGLAPCTKEEVARGRETVANKGGAICVQARSYPTEAEAACTAAVSRGVLRAGADALAVLEGGPALKAVGKSLLSEAGSGFVGFFANMRAVGGASAGKLARDRAKLGTAAGYAYGNALGAAGVSVVTHASSPQEDNRGFSLADLIPFRNIGSDIRSAVGACNPQ